MPVMYSTGPFAIGRNGFVYPATSTALFCAGT